MNDIQNEDIQNEDIQNEDIQNEQNIENDLNLKIISLQDETKKINEKYIRLMADYENYKKRSSKERDLMFNNITSEIISSFLQIYDSILLAIDSNKETNIKGIELILKQFEDILKNLNVEKIQINVKEKFDPNFHDAIMHIKDDTFGENEIAEILKHGFKIGNKIIRHAIVKVAN